MSSTILLPVWTQINTPDVDIPGHQTPAGGTLPPEVAISPLKPDIEIVDKTHKKVSIHELTCPAEHRIVTAYMLKD